MSNIRGPVIDQKYACLINFPIRHAFVHVMLYTLWKLEPSPCQLINFALSLDPTICQTFYGSELYDTDCIPEFFSSDFDFEKNQH